MPIFLSPGQRPVLMFRFAVNGPVINYRVSLPSSRRVASLLNMRKSSAWQKV